MTLAGRCERSLLEIPNHREEQIFVCDIAHYCIAQFIGLLRNKETLGRKDAQRSSYPLDNVGVLVRAETQIVLSYQDHSPVNSQHVQLNRELQSPLSNSGSQIYI